MKLFLILFSTLLLAVNGMSQDTLSARYYKKQFFKEVPDANIANYAKYEYLDEKETKYIVGLEISTKKILFTESFIKDGKPTGILLTLKDNEVSYDSLVYYSEELKLLEQNIPTLCDGAMSNLDFLNPDLQKFENSFRKIWNHIAQNLDYPMSAVDQDIKGTVIVQFIILANGDLSNFSIFQSAHPILDKAAMKVTKSLKQYNFKFSESECGCNCINILLPINYFF